MHLHAKRRLRDALVAAIAYLWRHLAGHDEANLPDFYAQVLPLVEAGQRQTIALTEAYLARTLGRRPLGVSSAEVIAGVRGEVEPREVYRRPFVTLWAGLGEGKLYAEASVAARARLVATIKTDLALAMTHAMREVGERDPEIEGFERVVRGTCDLCEDAAGTVTGTGSTMPIHPGCQCVAAPVQPLQPKKGAPPAIPDSSRGGLVVAEVREHGELGPILVDRDEKFTTEREAERRRNDGRR
jgi:hypothetical protein